MCNWILIYLALVSFPLSASPIKSDEYIQLMSGAAKLRSNGEVEVQVMAWVYEKEIRPGSKTLLALGMKLDWEKLSAEEKDTFDKRTQLFRIDSERNKDLSLQFPTQEEKLPITDAWGLTSKKILLKAGEAKHGDSISYHAILPKKDKREFAGSMLLVAEEGISVISDIDDTIKDSHVLDKQVLLRNTFINPLHQVEGMSDLYQSFNRNENNIAFHYVSSSPLQLFSLLTEFLQQEKFPAGSLHLRQVKVSEEIFKEGSSSQRHKHNQIRQLIKNFPKRQFVLIGDSGESDPEIYAEIARDHPDAILAIAIRDVTREAADASRYQKTFAGIDKNKWHIFSKPSAIENLLD